MWEILAVFIGSVLTRFISLEIERKKSLINIKMDMLNQCEFIYDELFSELKSIAFSNKSEETLFQSISNIKHMSNKIDAVKGTLELLSMNSKYIDELSNLKCLIDNWVDSATSYNLSRGNDNKCFVDKYNMFFTEAQEILDKNIHSIKILRAEVLTNICDKKRFYSFMSKK